MRLFRGRCSNHYAGHAQSFLREAGAWVPRPPLCRGGIVALSYPAVVLIVPVPGICTGKFGPFCRRSAGRFLRLACNAGRSDFYPHFGNGVICCGSVVAHSVNVAILRALLSQFVQCTAQGAVVGVDAGRLLRLVVVDDGFPFVCCQLHVCLHQK